MRDPRIERSSLRDEVRSRLRLGVLDGRWPPGTRLNDSALAKEMGVSRTPVREALIQLECERLVGCDLNRGFYVPSLDRSEVERNYPILWSLEQLAVFLAGDAVKVLKRKLEEANARFGATAGDAKAALQHDRAWHAAIAAASDNQRLVEMAGQAEAATRRYAAAFPGDAATHEQRRREHGQITDALATEQPARAFALLKMHWRAEMEWVLRGMEEAGLGAGAKADDKGALAARAGR